MTFMGIFILGVFAGVLTTLLGMLFGMAVEDCDDGVQEDEEWE